MRFKNICSRSELSGQGLVLKVYRQKEKSPAFVDLKTFTRLENNCRDLNECLDRENGGYT